MRVMDSVILRRSRRIWPSNVRFLSLAAQIVRCAQDDKRSARINSNLHNNRSGSVKAVRTAPVRA